MNKINIERLAVDEDYWDEVAPGEATGCALFIDGETWFRYDEEGIPQLWSMIFSEWRSCIGALPEKMIWRPTKQEWEGGFPPVGLECECWTGEEWLLGQSVGPYLDGWLCMLTNNIERPFIGSEGDFRPLKSQSERQRDELVDLLIEHRSSTLGDTADVILSRYTLEPKP